MKWHDEKSRKIYFQEKKISNKLRWKFFHVLHILLLLVKEGLDESTFAHPADARHWVLLCRGVKQLVGGSRHKF